MTRILQLNLQRYLILFASAPDEACALAICNKFGRQRLLVSSDLPGFRENLLHLLDNHLAWDAIPAYNGHLALNAAEHFYFAPIKVGAEEQDYWLIGFQQIGPQPPPPEQLTLSLEKLKQIAACLIDDYNQIEILSGMSEELTVRYEELNLLYGIDTVETLHKNNDEQESLNNLVKHCVDYLSIDFAAIYISDQNYFTYTMGRMEPVVKECLLENIIRQNLFPLIATNRETLVINSDNGSDKTNTDLHLPVKLIAAPIVKVNQTPVGVLVLINSLTKPDFNNSDRKLTDVLAAEASKLTQSRRDPVTGQLNRRGVSEKLENALTFSKADELNDCLLFIDLDQFRVVNDSVGQIGGDQLLRQITTLLLANLKKDDVLGRLSADEFAVILKHCTLTSALDVAERIRLAIKQFRFLYTEKMFDLSASIGVIELNRQFANFSDVLRAADLACTVAKENGKNRVHVYQKNDTETVKHENQMQWVSRINIGLEENRFLLYRQKIQSLQQDQAQGEHYEILIRLKGENGEVLSPYHFIPAAERYSIMSKIDRWVINEALSKIAKLVAGKPLLTPVFAINLSGQSFCEEEFLAFVKSRLNHYAVPGEWICFEITETAAVSNLLQTVQFMQELKQLGCSFSLDDFGSGVSSFTYLKSLPVDYLKIDGYFVKNMLENAVDLAMVKSIHQIGHVLGLKTIAEFIENQAIMTELTGIGLDYGQGYHIGKPEPFN